MPVRKTARDGEQLLTVNRQGLVHVHSGPTRVFVLGKKYQYLQRYSASQQQYLKVVGRDGKVDIKPGPCYMFHNPYEVDSITVNDALSLDASEVLVVYSRDKEGTVVRRLVHGPTLYVPQPNEWVHEFVWHGTDRNNKTTKKPGALTFTRLRVIPDRFYYNVPDVRTKDDALLTVKLMTFFELTDIERMLNGTVDPIGDFINALTADVVAFAATLTYEDFMENTSMLNILDNYKQLNERSRHIGYQVTKVVFRGYHASDKLQDLHDRAVQRRTQMKVSIEKETKEQDLTDFKLRNEHQREALEQNMKLEKLQHQQQLEKEKHLHELKLGEKQHEEMLRLKKEKALAELRARQKEQEEKLLYLRKLHSLGVDVTQYLAGEKPRPDNLLRVVTTGKGGNAVVHIHPQSQ